MKECLPSGHATAQAIEYRSSPEYPKLRISEIQTNPVSLVFGTSNGSRRLTVRKQQGTQEMRTNVPLPDGGMESLVERVDCCPRCIAGA